MKYSYAILALFVLVSCMSNDASAAAFTGMGSWTQGDHFGSTVFGISADGRIAAANTYSEQRQRHEGARWYWDRGLQGLGAHPTWCVRSSATGISPDGRTIVGSLYGESPSREEAFRWTAETAVQSLGLLPGWTRSTAADASWDGSVIVGTILNDGTKQPYIWTAADGIRLLGYLEGFDQCGATAVSYDGTVVVGDCGGTDGEAFRWTAEGGMQGLGRLPGDAFSRAKDVSADGRVIVGISGISEHRSEAFRWTEEDGMQGLGFVDGLPDSLAFAVSGDGTTVVGEGINYWSPEPDARQAFLWREDIGTVNLQDYIESELGLDTSGWLLRQSSAVSHDGLTIVGSGLNPNGDEEGWAVNLRRGNAQGSRALNQGARMLLMHE